MEETILSIKDLTISFNYQGEIFKAVNNVSLSIKPGQTLGIVGESGSGKSLTAKSILNLLPGNATIEKGEVHIFNKNNQAVNMLSATKMELENIRGDTAAMIFQEPMTSLNPVFKCGNQVLENIRKHRRTDLKTAKRRIHELFQEVKLPHPERIYNSFPHELSGGQRQRVMIAMALSCQPKLLIADEPTTALDVTVQKSILKLLRSLQEKYRMSLVFISHDLGVIAEIADEVAVMYQGEIVENGKLAQIIHNPKKDYTRGLIACRPSIHEKPHRLPTLDQFIDQSESSQKQNKLQHEIHETKQEVLFSIQNLNKSFTLKTNFFGKATETFNALININFQIFKGETLGLVGESGSGKTTLGRILLNLLPFENGAVSYQQLNIKKLSRKELLRFRQKVQIIFQDPYSSLNPKMSIGQIIEEPLKYHKILTNKKERRAEVMRLLNNVKLDESYFNRYPHELSGGQRQRIAIARVLSLNPEFIICDEAVSALDVSIQAEILNLLQELKERYQLTYIFISHDFSVVRFMADRIAVLKEGQLVELSEADQLFRSARSPYTVSLLESVPAF